MNNVNLIRGKNTLKIKAQNGIVKILKEEGVEWVSTFPTSGFNNALGEEGLPNLMLRTERYAIAVADGFSRVSNGKKFGVCTVQGGLNAVGIQMAYGALAQAYEDSTPLLCLTDGVEPEVTGDKRFNISEAFRSVTKWVGYINKVERVPEFMTRAYTYLRSGRPGPIVLQAPKSLEDFDESIFPYVSPKGWKHPGDPKDVKTAVKALLSASLPVIYAGQGIFYADACDELKEFAELVQAPVLTTLKGKSTFPEDHPLSIGVKGIPTERFLQKSDLIFAIGNSLAPGRRYGGFLHHIPDTRRVDDSMAMPGKKIVQITNSVWDINNYYLIDHAILGDAKLVLRQLIDTIKEQRRLKVNEKLVQDISSAKKEKNTKYMPLMTSKDKPINPYRVYYELMNTIDRENSFVTHESGGTREQLATVYEAKIPHGFMGWGRVSTLGFSLGAAIGAKLAYPKRQVVNITGDAGIAYMLGNIESSLRNEIGITTIHINNSGFSGYGPGFWGKGSTPYTYKVTPSSASNMADTVGGLGVHAERIEEPDEIVSALKRAFKKNQSNEPAFIEFICSQHPVYGAWLVQ
jgi:acetolactate synthase-1/2/3 large subunit